MRDAKGDTTLDRDDAPKGPVTVVGADFWGSDAHTDKMDDAWMGRFAKLTDLESVNFNFSGARDPAATTAGSREFAALVNLRWFAFGSRVKGGFDVSVLAKMPSLERLEVTGMNGSEWVPHAVGLKNLRQIFMSFGTITDADLDRLAGLPCLSFVSVNGPTPVACRAFAKKLPWCRVSGMGVNIEPTALLPLDQEWADAVAALPPEKQAEAVLAELKKRNPTFDEKSGESRHKVEGGRVAELEFRIRGKGADLTPVRALTGLTGLIVTFDWSDQNEYAAAPNVDLTPLRQLSLTRLALVRARLTDLTPLKGLKLTRLNLFGTHLVSDLSPLAGMPLEALSLRDLYEVKDLTPLEGMKLKELDLTATPVSDVKALAGMPLEKLQCAGGITDLTPLKGMKLTFLTSNATDLSPLKGMPLQHLECINPKLADLSPLEGMPLKALRYELNLARDGKVLRSLKQLELLNDKPAAEVLK